MTLDNSTVTATLHPFGENTLAGALANEETMQCVQHIPVDNYSCSTLSLHKCLFVKLAFSAICCEHGATSQAVTTTWMPAERGRILDT